MVAVAIVAILVALLAGNYDRIVLAAQQATCTSRMRSIHHGLNLYLQDNKDIWPQAPEIKREKAWEAFWLQTLLPFGVEAKTWQCPAIKSLVRRGGDDATSIHYAPSTFDDTPGIARRWPTQPWLIERADVHGQGPLVCFPDGSIKSMRRVLYEQGLIR
jgi:type II secretory pathway pseudopilin PulG